MNPSQDVDRPGSKLERSSAASRKKRCDPPRSIPLGDIGINAFGDARCAAERVRCRAYRVRGSDVDLLADLYGFIDFDTEISNGWIPSSNVRANVGPHEDFLFGGRSAPPSCDVTNGCRTSQGRERCWPPIPARAWHMAVWSIRLECRDLQTGTGQDAGRAPQRRTSPRMPHRAAI